MIRIINKSQVKIFKSIFNNPGINLRGIIESTKLSPNYVLEYVNELVKRGVLVEEKLEKKRIYLRRFFLNFNSNLTKNIFLLIKEEEKEGFFTKYPHLRSIFNQIIEEIKKIDFLIVYGSYARMNARKNSDIDILIVGNLKNKEKIREALVSFETEASIKVEALKNFKKKKDDAIHNQIIKEGILIYDSGKFVGAIKK